MTYISETMFYNPLVDGYEQNQSKELGKNDFLNLLVTQLRYQNPLEPMQDQEFVAQLAQFSQLEQLENMSSTLETNSQVNYLMSQTIANTMATTLIGKTVIAEGSDFVLSSDSDVDISFRLKADAASTTINIFDEGGSLVRTITLDDLSKGNNTITWDGKNDGGTRLAPGQYSYEVHASTASGEEIGVDKLVIGAVESIKYEDGMAYLMVGGYKVDLGSIIEIVQGSGSVMRDQD